MAWSLNIFPISVDRHSTRKSDGSETETNSLDVSGISSSHWGRGPSSWPKATEPTTRPHAKAKTESDFRQKCTGRLEMNAVGILIEPAPQLPRCFRWDVISEF